MKPAKDINRLIEIMAALRDKETGCPWDIEQDFHSILPYTLEEVYEVADAIQRDDKIDLCDELGDLLLQVVYYAQMAKEEGSFSFEDVVFAITNKMIRRHPHVFGTKEQKNKEAVKDQWDAIKQQEKQQRQKRRADAGLKDDSDYSYLAKIKTTQPADKEAFALQKQAAKVGFDWQKPEPIINKLHEEIKELETAICQKKREEIIAEFGDLYFTVINLARRLNINPEAALQQTNKKFRHRFHAIETSLKAENKSFDDTNLEEMEVLWEKAKTAERKV